uniref:Putative secreted protein n=1 Tax=Anopheles darlingi TaxID=43151 RepID=A0A2M4DEC6_ANODA
MLICSQLTLFTALFLSLFRASKFFSSFENPAAVKSQLNWLLMRCGQNTRAWKKIVVRHLRTLHIAMFYH